MRLNEVGTLLYTILSGEEGRGGGRRGAEALEQTCSPTQLKVYLVVTTIL